MKVKSSDLNWADVVLLGRLDSWYEYHLTRLLRKAGKYLIYIIDDDLLNIPSYLSSAAYYGQPVIQRNIRAMMEMSDAILSPSPLLLEKYAGTQRKAIPIEEPSIHPVCYRPHNLDGPVKIGFAGSIDRKDDIELLLKDALLRIKQEFGEGVAFEFFGAIPSFAKGLGARAIPYCDSYDTYRETLNRLEWDIGLAPMPDTPFHACKHYNKFVEYAAAGIAGIYSRLQPYVRAEERFAGALYCENTPEAWYTAIRQLVTDRALREKLRQEACECAHGPVSVQVCAENFSALICTLPIVAHSMSITTLQITSAKPGYLFHRFQTVLKANNISSLFIKLIQKMDLTQKTRSSKTHCRENNCYETR